MTNLVPSPPDTHTQEVADVFFRSSCFAALLIGSSFSAGLDDYTLYARYSMTIDDRAMISGDGPTGIGTGGDLMANVRCVLYGGISSYGNVTIRDRTVVNGNIFSHGTVTGINQPVINGFYREYMPVETFSIPTYAVTPGGIDKTIANNATLVLPPGNYRDLTAYANSTLRLSAGTYQFRNFTIYTDVHILLNAPSGDVVVKVAEECAMGDRTHIESYSGAVNPLNVHWYSNQSMQIGIGTVCQLIGVFTAPNAAFKLGARSTLKGAVYAKSITLDPDSKVEKCGDTRYVDSDFDDVPDVVETAMGTNPANGASTPKVAHPSSWYADASQTITVHYDLSMFPKYFYHTDVPITIPAGVNTRAYNPIISIPEPDEIGVPLSLPTGNFLVAVYNIKAGIAPLQTLLLGFPLPGASMDLNFANIDNYLLQHYNENTNAWETVPIAFVENNVIYANLASNGPFAISGIPTGLNTINDLHVCVDDDGAAVLEEKNYTDPTNDVIITDEQRLEKVRYSLDQFRTIMPQMRYSFVPTTATADLHLFWVENARTLSDEACFRYYDPPSTTWFASGWVEGLSFFGWDDAPDFNKVTPCPAVPADPGGASSTAHEDNTIWFQPFNSHYSLNGTAFVAREEIYDEWNRNLRENIYRREFVNSQSITNRMTGSPLNAETDVFHPAGNQLTGANLTWVVKHELGHCLGLGGDNQQRSFIDLGVSSLDPTPGNTCPACECITRNLCRPMIDEWEGVICYEDGFPIRNQFFNDDLMREFDARDLVTNTDFVVSYPYTRFFVRMQNRTGARYTTSNWYDARYRMFETPFTINDPNNNPQRFFVMGLDSVMVTTVAGSNGVAGDIDGAGANARLNKPQVLFIDDANGNLYFGVSAKIKVFSATGVVSTFAGTGVPGYANGPRLSAQFDGDFCAPFCRNTAGDIFVCERNVNRIRRIDAAGNVTLFAGSATGTAGYADGTGGAALFNWPSSMCIDAAGNLYVVDYNNHVIRRITSAGVVTTFAGTAGTPGNTDGTLANALFRTPCGIAIDRTGNLYVAERDNFCIRFIDMAASSVSRFAGDGTSGFVDGPVLSAKFGVASDLHVDARGIVYVADAANNAIRKIAGGTVSTIAGRPGDAVLYRDGCGTDARFNNPGDVAADTKGNIFVTEEQNHVIRKISTRIPLTINAPALGARLEDINDAVWVEFTVTDNVTDTITITPDPLFLGAGATPVPAPATVGVDATLYGPDNYYLTPVFNETNGNNVLVTRSLVPGRYLLKVFAHNAAYASGAFSVRVANTQQIISVPAIAGNTTTLAGNLEREGDNDWFRINVTAAATLTIETVSRSSGLTTAPVIYMYRDSEGLPVGGVPRVSTPAGVTAVPGVTEDNVAANPLNRRLLRDGRTQISTIRFDTPINVDPGNRLNETGIYWIRIRSGMPVETGTYALRVTRNR